LSRANIPASLDVTDTFKKPKATKKEAKRIPVVADPDAPRVVLPVRPWFEYRTKKIQVAEPPKGKDVPFTAQAVLMPVFSTATNEIMGYRVIELRNNPHDLHCPSEMFPDLSGSKVLQAVQEIEPAESWAHFQQHGESDWRADLAKEAHDA
jgi:hypothetical protein